LTRLTRFGSEGDPKCCRCSIRPRAREEDSLQDWRPVDGQIERATDALRTTQLMNVKVDHDLFAEYRSLEDLHDRVSVHMSVVALHGHVRWLVVVGNVIGRG
jgi:hypothetical protein